MSRRKKELKVSHPISWGTQPTTGEYLFDKGQIKTVYQLTGDDFQEIMFMHKDPELGSS